MWLGSRLWRYGRAGAPVAAGYGDARPTVYYDNWHLFIDMFVLVQRGGAMRISRPAIPVQPII